MIVLPHLGASTGEAEENCAVMVADQVRDYLVDGTIRNSVNFPDVVLPRESRWRVAIANANVPNMVGGISHEMAEAGLNIATMTNKSRRDLAYTLVDVDSDVPDPGDQGDRRDRRRADGALPSSTSWSLSESQLTRPELMTVWLPPLLGRNATRARTHAPSVSSR